jgi:transposase
MKAQPKASTEMITESAVFIGVDFHKRYSVYHVIDAAGQNLAKGRIDHQTPEQFGLLVQRWPDVRVAFEASMNWHWLYEVLERSMPGSHITLANPFKTRIIAEAQVKTDKVDARILALLLRAELICAVHIPARETRQRKEVLRQRCFFVRQRTTLRNRIHRLLGAQHDLKLPQVSDLFGKKGMSFLEKLELPAPHGLLLRQQLELLKSIQLRVKEDEAALAVMMEDCAEMKWVLSIPGMGPILAPVVINEIDGIERFSSAQKLCGYCGLCPSTSSSGGKTYNGKLLKHCNKWLRWAFVEAAWVAIGNSAYFADIYRKKRAYGKKANTAILCVARRMARITWQLLTQRREYTASAPSPHPSCQHPNSRPGEVLVNATLEGRPAQPEQNFPSRSENCLVGPKA